MNIIGFCKTLSVHLRMHNNEAFKQVLKDHPRMFRKYKTMTNVQGNLYNHYEVAIRSGNIQGLCILIENGFDLYRNNRNGYNPLEAAVSVSDVNTVCLLKSLGCVYNYNCLYNFIESFGALKTCNREKLEMLMIACGDEDFTRAFGDYISGEFFDNKTCFRLLEIISDRIDVNLPNLMVTPLNREFSEYLFDNGNIDSSTVLRECTRTLCFRDYPVDTNVSSLRDTILMVVDKSHGYGSDIRGFTDICDTYKMSGYTDPLILSTLECIDDYIKFNHRLPFLLKRIRHTDSSDNFMSEVLGLPPGVYSNVIGYLV